MEGPPGDEGPVGAMPEAAQEENHKSIAYNFRFRASAAAQRDVHIIPEPGRQRDMPSTPEFRDVTTEVRHIEVLHRLETEKFPRTDGHIRIP